MKFIKRNIQRNQKRNKDLVLGGVATAPSSSTSIGASIDTSLYDKHIADKVIHITDEERKKWNEKLDKKTWDDVFTVEGDKLRVKLNLIGEKSVSAHGIGSSGGSGSNFNVINSLDSESTTDALSAKQGKVLKGLIDSKTVDLTDYYNKKDVETLLLPKADESYVDKKITDLVNNAPETMDTLKELSDALITNQDAVKAINASITNKSDKNHTHIKSDITDLDLSSYDNHIADSTIHITPTERVNWNNASSLKHTHNNKSIIDSITQSNLENWNGKLDKSVWDRAFYFDGNDLRVKINVVGEQDVSAFGKGTGSSEGIFTVVNNLESDSINSALSAAMGKELKRQIDTKTVDVDLTDYYKKKDVDTLFQPKGNYLTAIPKEYVTEAELNAKGFITSHQSLSDYYKKSEVNNELAKKSNIGHKHTKSEITDLDLTPYNSHIANNTKHITSAERTSWNNKVDNVTGKGLSSNDYTTTEKAKLEGIAEGANKYIHPNNHPATMITEDATHRFVSDAEKTKWNNKLDKSIWDRAFYFDGDNLKVHLNLIGDKEISAYGKGEISSGGGAITIIDSLNSDAANAALSANQGRILKEELDKKQPIGNYLTSHQSLSGYAKETWVTSEIAKAATSGKVDLTGYAKTEDIPTKTSQLSNDSGFITDISGKVDKTTYTNDKKLLATKSDISDMLTKTTAKGLYLPIGNYLKTIPSEYITETELDAKGYLTSHQSLSGYAKTSQIPTKVSLLSNDRGYITSYTNNYVSSITGTGNGTITFNRNGLNPLTLDLSHTHSLYLTSSSLNGYAKTSQIPTKVSQLTNDKGYLTSHQPLTNYYTKDQVNTELSKKSDTGHAHTIVQDAYDGRNTTFAYSQPCIGLPTYLAGWNGSELRAVESNQFWTTSNLNPVTLNTSQNISGAKTFTSPLNVKNSIYCYNLGVGDGLVLDGDTRAKIDADGYSLDIGTDGGITGDVNIGNNAGGVNINTQTNINGNTNIIGNLIVSGEITAYSSSGANVPFLYNDSDSNSTSQAASAAALKKVNDNLQNQITDLTKRLDAMQEQINQLKK